MTHKIISSPVGRLESFPTFNLGRPHNSALMITSYELRVCQIVHEIREEDRLQARFALGCLPTFRLDRSPEGMHRLLFKRIDPYKLEIERALAKLNEEKKI